MNRQLRVNFLVATEKPQNVDNKSKVKNCTSSEKWLPLALLIASALDQ
jgi:hypothetical protein